MKRPEPIKRIRKYWRGRRRPSIQEVVRETSSGGIVYRINGKSEVEILLIQDSKDRWSIPKGQINVGEAPKDAAAREISEETGLKEMTVLNWLGKVHFRYRRAQSLVLKTMHVYLVRAEGNSGQLKKEQVDYITKVQWFSVNEALDKIEYDDIGTLILLALKKIRQMNS